MSSFKNILVNFAVLEIFTFFLAVMNTFNDNLFSSLDI